MNGKQARLTGIITRTEICINPPAAFYSIYGDGHRSEQKCFAIKIELDKHKPDYPAEKELP